MEEIWKPVDFDGRYQVSNLGNVRSCVDFHGCLSNNYHYLTPKISKHGYLMVYLHLKGKKTKGKLIHRLVAEAFIPNTNDSRCVNHKDEDKTNNRVDNLEWCSYSYNNNYGTRNQRLSMSLTDSPLITKPVLQIDRQGNIINEFPSIKKAAEYIGCRVAEISRVCCNYGYRHTAHGFVWKFKNKNN